MSPSKFRLVVSRYHGEDLFFFFDTKAELTVAEMMIMKGLSGASGRKAEQWVDKDHIRYNGEAGYMPISIF
jgi:hypothetical protein